MEVANVPPPPPTQSLRASRAAAAKIKVEKVLHQAQHHTFPRAKAMIKKFKTSTKKLKLVAKLVRRARVDAALMQLALSPKRVSKVVRRCIYSAKFNAANNHGMDPDNLMIDEIILGRSSYLKRVEFKGRGRTGVRRLPYCHLTVYVREIRPEDPFSATPPPAPPPPLEMRQRPHVSERAGEPSRPRRGAPPTSACAAGRRAA
eukprot:CAMPEP_0172172728 /NCGR_PEP_ID=MMETSP1050-20130122/12618_1 /TAXON_ID=233186 /ORGANISM="Cryptomonas curvata, Strain CCAP979/52" /LENGTH=202 /DNA_ID=CAMNT_0012844321 /DNA_START=268 /DNA_END=872 /DNA_ORIENTATION=-